MPLRLIISICSHLLYYFCYSTETALLLVVYNISHLHYIPVYKPDLTVLLAFIHLVINKGSSTIVISDSGSCLITTSKWILFCTKIESHVFCSAAQIT